MKVRLIFHFVSGVVVRHLEDEPEARDVIL